LPTVAAIAEAHQGSVRVNSTVGKGSTFEILLPTELTAAVTGDSAPSGAAAASA
jgi:signal transduction histidine kinase